ncbi:interleukin-18 isoform X2 [Ascaphus truei]|uniref:interleukin-18 isoform X2 n=1 Tax=Ascaphus truei TaxID=8439 RepID=UPI003F5A6A65
MTETNQNCCIQFYVLDNTLCSKVIRSGCNEFREVDETDSYRSAQSGSPPMPRHVTNYKHRLLVASTEESAATFEADGDTKESGSMFFLHKYKDNSLHRAAIAVLFTVTVDSRNYLMYCTNDGAIHFKEGDKPKDIPSDRSEFIFYMKKFSTGSHSLRFESSLKKDFYLAFQDENDIHQLVLKYCPLDVLDETIMMKVNFC